MAKSNTAILEINRLYKKYDDLLTLDHLVRRSLSKKELIAISDLIELLETPSYRDETFFHITKMLEQLREVLRTKN